MGSAANRAKTKWSSIHYTQVKVSIDPDIATVFKAACKTAGESMASVLTREMTRYSKAATSKKSSGVRHMDTRGKRRRIVQDIILLLEQVKEAEEQYQDCIPDNLKNSRYFEAAGESIDALDEVLDKLQEVY